MLGLLGKKLGHTRVYNEQGVVVPVTVVLAGPNRVIQCKTVETDGYKAVQLGFEDQKEQRLTKPLLGHLKKHNAPPVKRIKEFRDFSRDVKPGDVIGATLFAKGDFIDAIGITKGRGFEGVVKRHRFRGGDMTHGAKGWHRRSGAIGCRLLLLIKGAIPGAEGDYVVIRESKKIPKGTVRKTAPPPAKAKGAKAAAAPAKTEAKPAAAAVKAAAKPAATPAKTEAKPAAAK